MRLNAAVHSLLAGDHCPWPWKVSGDDARTADHQAADQPGVDLRLNSTHKDLRSTRAADLTADFP
jgi:hypothetical protein